MERYNIDRRTALRLVGLAAAGGVAGCLGSTSESVNTSAQEENGEQHGNESEGSHAHDEEGSNGQRSTATVDMVTTNDGYHFEPHVVWVKVGGTVTWVNMSGSHTSTAYHPDNEDKPLRIPEDAESWGSGLKTEQGATFEHTFEVEGVYDYYCEPHEANGMVGSVVVGEPDLHDQPALRPAQDGLPRGARLKIGDINHMVENMIGVHSGDSEHHN